MHVDVHVKSEQFLAEQGCLFILGCHVGSGHMSLFIWLHGLV